MAGKKTKHRSGVRLTTVFLNVTSVCTFLELVRFAVAQNR